ncbi:MAG: hypothetical protein AB7O62_21565 [Pirellulales bacterium]
MPHQVLSVGQCGMDHGSISRLIEGRFDASVAAAATARQALDLLRGGEYQLVLVNRLFDQDGGSGLEFLRQLKQNPAMAAVPMMLVTNYPDVQAQAVAVGALAGFGKNDLTAPQTVEKLAAVLGDRVKAKS